MSKPFIEQDFQAIVSYFRNLSAFNWNTIEPALVKLQDFVVKDGDKDKEQAKPYKKA